MPNKLITKIVLAYLALAAIAAPLLWFYISGSIEGYFTDRIADNLRAQAMLISGGMPVTEKGGGLDALAKDYKARTGARVTILNADGKVLGDSDEDSSLMENHLQRPEVQAAAATGWGRATRYSHTLKIDMLYVAVPLKSGGFVRLSMPLHEVEQTMSSIKRRVAAGAFIIFLAAILLGVYLSRRITGKVGRMASFTRKVASGDFTSRLRADSGDELGLLALNLNDMAGQLSEKMDAVTREKATLEAVLGGMVEGVLVTDKDGRVILANRRLRDTFGIKKEDALGRPFLEVIRNNGLLDLVRLAHERREMVAGEVEVEFPESLNFIAGCVPLTKNDEFSGVVMVLHDVTRLKALERVRRDFVANVTHELKTPIAAIQGFSETLLAGALEEKENALRFIGIIESNSRRLSRLIEDLLVLSKIELGEIRLDLKPVSINNVVGEVTALLGPKLREKELRLDMNVGDEAPKILADRDKLYQIILNVMDNAVKFAPIGGTVGVTARLSGGGMVELSISDTGVGIPPELLPRLGERFFRVDTARSRELGGTGLGLAIVKHLVKAHNGTFSIESRPNKGTTVTMRFRAATKA